MWVYDGDSDRCGGRKKEFRLGLCEGVKVQYVALGKKLQSEEKNVVVFCA